MLYVLDHAFCGRHFEKRLVGSADEHETLLCLRLCTGSEDGARRLVDHPSGLFTVAVCVMSNFRYAGFHELSMNFPGTTYSTVHEQYECMTVCV
jgi:hypothetical protein